MSSQQYPSPHPPQGYGPPQDDTHGSGGPGDAVTAEPPRRQNFLARHKILSTLLAVLLLGSCVGALAGGEEQAGDTDVPAATETSSDAVTSGGESAGSSASSQGSTADEPAAEEDADEATEDESRFEEDSQAAEEEPAEEAAARPGIGDSVTVKDFEITVTGVETGIGYVGPQGWGEEPQGQFVKVLVTVQNNGNSAQMFFDSEQKLLDEQDREHSTSSAGIYLDEASLWLTDINPGNTATGALLYDVPADAMPTTLKVSSGFLGRTAEIDLR